jgi:hypothetical protein
MLRLDHCISITSLYLDRIIISLFRKPHWHSPDHIIIFRLYHYIVITSSSLYHAGAALRPPRAEPLAPTRPSSSGTRCRPSLRRLLCPLRLQISARAPTRCAKTPPTHPRTHPRTPTHAPTHPRTHTHTFPHARASARLCTGGSRRAWRRPASSSPPAAGTAAPALTHTSTHTHTMCHYTHTQHTHT